MSATTAADVAPRTFATLELTDGPERVYITARIRGGVLFRRLTADGKPDHGPGPFSADDDTIAHVN